MKRLEEESIDDIQLNGFRLIQKKRSFRFGQDAVLLANFVRAKSLQVGVDLGTGTGIIPTIILAKSDVKHMIGIEVQEDIADMARRSVQLNQLEDRLSILPINLCDVERHLERESFDFVTANPPYMDGKGLKSEADTKRIARHEILCSLEDVMRSASYLLKQKGNFFLVHRPNRFQDIACFARKYRLEMKEVRMVQSFAKSKPNLMLIKLVKYANSEIRWSDPLIIYGPDGQYTDEILRMYASDELGEY